MVGSAQIIRNGYIKSSPTYVYSKTAYTGGNHSTIRDWMNDESLILALEDGENYRDLAWRQIKAINEYVSQNCPWPDLGLNTDLGTYNPNDSTLNYLSTIGKKATIFGGAFTAAPGSLSSVGYLVERGKDTPTWTKLSEGLAGGSNRVNCMVEFNGELVIGGSFSSATHPTRGTTTLGNIARWVGDHFEPFEVRSTTDFSGEVFALYVWNNQLYVGGGFTSVAGKTAFRVARWNGTEWETLPPGGATGGANGFGNTVYAFYEYNNKLLIGGRMVNIRGTNTHSHLTQYDGGTTSSAYTWLDGTTGNGSNNFTTSTSGNVWCLTSYSGNLVIGGSFLTCNGVTYNHIVSWNGSALSALGTGVDSASLDTGAAPNTAIRCMTTFGSDLVVGGHFGAMSGVASTQYIAKWNGSAWSAMGAGITTTGNFVRSFYTLGSDLVVGSTLANGASDAGDFIQKWTGSAWAAFASGFDGVVAAIGEYGYHWSCARIARLAQSMAIAVGIPARALTGIDAFAQVDGAWEAYDARYNKWVLMLPHMNFWVEDRFGVPLSSGELKAAVLAGQVSITFNNWIYTFNAANGSGLVGMPDNIIRQPVNPMGSISGWCPKPSNAVPYSGTNDGFLLETISFQYVCDVNSVPPVVTEATGITDMRDDNISYPLNQLVASTQVVNGKVRITLTDSMFDDSSLLYQQNTGSGWVTMSLTEISPGVYEWAPTGDATILLRVRNFALQSSNDVEIRAFSSTRGYGGRAMAGRPYYGKSRGKRAYD